MGKRTRNSKLMASINLVPFIDVVLVLLISFMVVSPVVTQGVQVTLPKVTAQPIAQSAANQWILTIREDEQLFLTRGSTSAQAANRPTDIKTLTAIFKKQLKETPELTLYIRADEALPYGEVMGILGELQDEGLTQIALITEPKR